MSRVEGAMPMCLSQCEQANVMYERNSLNLWQMELAREYGRIGEVRELNEHKNLPSTSVDVAVTRFCY
jgi:hypothetical protein